jgi:hypothetical protein
LLRILNGLTLQRNKNKINGGHVWWWVRKLVRLWLSFHNASVYQNITLYALNIYNFCQSYLNRKTEENKESLCILLLLLISVHIQWKQAWTCCWGMRDQRELGWVVPLKLSESIQLQMFLQLTKDSELSRGKTRKTAQLNTGQFVNFQNCEL